MRHRRWRLTLGSLALALMLVPALPRAQEPQNPRIGQVKTLTGKAVVIRDGNREQVNVGDPIYRSDVIETRNGTIGLTLIDNSVFSTGPESHLSFQEFRFDPTTKTNSMLAELRKGTLTIVTGDIPHSGPEAMKIKTPTSILGIRGTTFAIEVH